MALFPDCTFTVLVPTPCISGQRSAGTLVLDVPRPIPRADHVELVFRSTAWAGYGSGKSRSVYRRTMFLAPFHVPLPRDRPLEAGQHRFPFAIDLPAGLPPALAGNDCGIQHEIEVRLDVDWARDPHVTLMPTVALPPEEGFRQPLVTRTTAAFHADIVLEVTLPSATIVWGDERLEGRVALRSGHDARFSAVLVSVVSRTTIRMARTDQRRGGGTTVRIPSDMMRSGEAVPFAFPLEGMRPTFRNGFIDHDLLLVVSVDLPWGLFADPEHVVPLVVLPRGSTVHGETASAPIGFERVRNHALAMASATGLRPGQRMPVLVSGNVGPVHVTLEDAPMNGQLGVAVSFELPDVELGIAFRGLGVLDGFRHSPLLPAPLDDRYLLRVEGARGRPPLDDETLTAFFAAALGDLGAAGDVHLSDHHLKVHLRLPNDSSAEMIALANAAVARATAIGQQIALLPFPALAPAAARASWQATAVEQNATLVPTGPSLHGLRLATRILGGDERAMPFAIRTDGPNDAVVTRVDVDLAGMPMPRTAWAELEGPATERLAAVRAVFPTTHATAVDHASLECPGFVADPRALFGAIDAFFQWVLDVRGERRAVHAYR